MKSFKEIKSLIRIDEKAFKENKDVVFKIKSRKQYDRRYQALYDLQNNYTALNNYVFKNRNKFIFICYQSKMN